MLPRRIPKEPKRASRWKSQAHRDFVRQFACAMCGSTANREVAHVRLGSGAGMGQKPDDWRTVPLCAGPNANKDAQLGCHNRQHVIGEQTFWETYRSLHGQTVEQLIADFIKASPKRQDIERTLRERGDSLTSARAFSQ
jgi:hypothetical protein